MPPNSTIADFEIEVVESAIQDSTLSENVIVDSTTQQTKQDSNIENVNTKVSEVKNDDESSIASTLENSGIFLSLILCFLQVLL